jgi:hypothetical protein
MIQRRNYGFTCILIGAISIQGGEMMGMSILRRVRRKKKANEALKRVKSMRKLISK